MEDILIQASTGNSRIIFDKQLSDFPAFVPRGKKVIVITDGTIASLYGKYFAEYPVVTLGEGEKHKTLDSLSRIFAAFLENNVDRSWFVVGIGGGIVCDVTGFASSIYMRGLPCGFVSTTLLSQVDASVGGKNGVNFGEFKNMLGVFAQPSFVICDASVLASLPEREYISGFAEIIKAAAIRNFDLFEYLEQHAAEALDKKPEVVSKAIYESVKIKANVVQNDEKESGERRILNFGHTFAHSIELHMGLTHGEAVAVGMMLAAKASVKLGLLSLNDADRLQQLLEKYHLPTRFTLQKELVYSTLLKDKKREGDAINLVLLTKLGNAVVQKVPLNQMEEIVNDLC